MHGVGISAIASVPDLEELFYFHATGVLANYELKRNTEQIIQLRVDYIQADNQLGGAFPRVMIQKVLNSKRDDQPCFSLHIITLPNNNKGLFHINILISRYTPALFHPFFCAFFLKNSSLPSILSKSSCLFCMNFEIEQGKKVGGCKLYV